jgi:Na+/proline symporter
MEWIALIIVAVVEFIAWLVAMFGDPMFFVIYAYISLWAAAILYMLPVILIIVHSVNNGTSNTINWTTDGGLPHLIIGIFIWLITGLFHYFFYPELVVQYSQQLGDRLQGVFAPANYISDKEKRQVTTIYDVNNYGEVPQDTTNDVKNNEI